MHGEKGMTNDLVGIRALFGVYFKKLVDKVFRFLWDVILVLSRLRPVVFHVSCPSIDLTLSTGLKGWYSNKHSKSARGQPMIRCVGL